MSTAGLIDIPLDIFSGEAPFIPAEDLPPGASGGCQDVQFNMGEWATRPGLLSQFKALSDGAAVNGLATFYGTINLPSVVETNPLIAFDAAGNLYYEVTFGPSAGTLAILAANAAKAANFMVATSAFDRLYMAFGDGIQGQSLPRQFDGTNFDRLTQGGPGAPPTAADLIVAPATVDNTGAGSGVTIANSPTGAIATDPVAIPPYPPYYPGGTYWTTVTFTTTTAHGLSVGELVNITGVGYAPFNATGAAVIAVPSPTSFKISLYSYVAEVSGGGTVTPQLPSLVRQNNVVTATTSAPHGFAVKWSVQLSGFAALAAGSSWTAVENNGIVTLTSATAHGIPVGAYIIVAGMGDATYDTPNGAIVLSVPSATTLTYAASTSTGSTSGGTVSVPWSDVTGNGFQILSVPTPTSFTYADPGPNGVVNGSGTATVVGHVSAGQHQLVVIFVTRQGLATECSPIGSWVANGGNQAILTNIPTGPSNVVQRIVAFTGANGASFFYIPAPTAGSASGTVINDNVTTTFVMDFTDSVLLNSTNVDEYFNRVYLSAINAVVPYALRLAFFGERNKMQNWTNPAFDGGWNLAGGTGGSDVPLGWTSDPVNGAGGHRSSAISEWADAYQMQSGGTSPNAMITQSATTDTQNQPRIQPNIGYSVRIWVAASAGQASGSAIVELYSPSQGSQGLFAVTSAEATTEWQEFTGVLCAALASVPPDLVLRVYSTSTTNAQSFYVDEIEIFPTNTPVNTNVVRWSQVETPEVTDGETDIMVVPTPDNDRLTTGFKLREKFYICGTHSLFSTEDNGSSEPSGWDLEEISNLVGACSPRAVALGEEWAILVCRTGVYILWAGVAEPVKISQEEQPVWEAINWAEAETIWTVVDTARKRLFVGVPMGAATQPNQVLYMDFQGLDTASDIASYHSVRYSQYSGKILTIGDARKWTPWTIAANCCSLVERSDGTQHVFFGNNVGDGNVYDIVDGQTTDNGAAIPWSYSTHMIPAAIERQMYKLGSGRMIFGYLRGYVEGAGQMAISYQPMGNAAPTALPPLNLADPNAAPTMIATSVRKGGIATITTTTPHGLSNGVDFQANIAGGTDKTFDGTFALQVVQNANQLTLYQPALPDSNATGGTIGRVARPFEFTTNVVAERCMITFSNYGNTAGTWARMKALTPYLAPDPWAPARGTVN